MSPGSVFNGDVLVNNRELDKKDFGKIGAYVQQHDILVQTMTPKECLTFAALLRTNLTRDRLEFKVEDLLRRLGLWNCKDTKIGGVLFKGISGGEKKRVSIGYELITEP